MAALPATAVESPTVAAMRSWWASKLGRLSRRLGASQIGRECERELWYSFRWAFTSHGQRFDGWMLRLFDRGHREEAVFTAELRGIGIDVRDLDPSTGEQFEFTGVSGHFVAKIDGVAQGVIEAPKTWHVVSYKTSNAKGFAAILKQGVAVAKPEHVAQNQVEMHLADLTRTLYLVVNKDDDTVHGERIRYDAAAAARLMAKAERVVFAPEPLLRLSDDPAFFKCKFCDHTRVCHGSALPKPSCRTCLHATPERDGDGRWSCARYRDDAGNPETLPLEVQQAGCPEHRYIPALLARWGEAVDASEADNWVLYRAADGLEFRNGAWGLGSYTSTELHAVTPSVLRDAEFLAIRERTAGRFALAEAA